MNKTEYVAALRELADFVESKDFPNSWKGYWNGEDSFNPPRLEIYTNNRSDFGRICLALGSYDKERGDYQTGAKKSLSAGAHIKVSAARDVVCKKIVVGKRVVPAEPEKIIEATPEREEDIVEWECPESFGALAKEPKEDEVVETPA